MVRRQSKRGFTLAELLIALMILGEIATFTIPKLLVTQQNTSFNANTKEAAAAIANAYQMYKLNNSPVPTTMSTADLTPYLNYVKLITTTYNIDQAYGGMGLDCGSTGPCVLLQNGGILMLRSDRSFGGNSLTHGVSFLYDPDGKYDGTTNGPGKSMQFRLLYNGRLTTRDGGVGTTGSEGYWAACASPCDPPWFSW